MRQTTKEKRQICVGSDRRAAKAGYKLNGSQPSSRIATKIGGQFNGRSAGKQKQRVNHIQRCAWLSVLPCSATFCHKVLLRSKLNVVKLKTFSKILISDMFFHILDFFLKFPCRHKMAALPDNNYLFKTVGRGNPYIMFSAMLVSEALYVMVAVSASLVYTTWILW